MSEPKSAPAFADGDEAWVRVRIVKARRGDAGDLVGYCVKTPGITEGMIVYFQARLGEMLPAVPAAP